MAQPLKTTAPKQYPDLGAAPDAAPDPDGGKPAKTPPNAPPQLHQFGSQPDNQAVSRPRSRKPGCNLHSLAKPEQLMDCPHLATNQKSFDMSLHIDDGLPSKRFVLYRDALQSARLAAPFAINKPNEIQFMLTNDHLIPEEDIAAFINKLGYINEQRLVNMLSNSEIDGEILNKFYQSGRSDELDFYVCGLKCSFADCTNYARHAAKNINDRNEEDIGAMVVTMGPSEDLVSHTTVLAGSKQDLIKARAAASGGMIAPDALDEFGLDIVDGWVGHAFSLSKHPELFQALGLGADGKSDKQQYNYLISFSDIDTEFPGDKQKADKQVPDMQDEKKNDDH